MEEKAAKKQAGMKRAIVILSVLLAVSLAALVGTLIYRRAFSKNPATVTVPDNIISPDPTAAPSASAPALESVPVPSSDAAQTELPTYETTPTTTAAESAKEAAVISLYQKHGTDNKPFQVGNMFPGDVETKYFCVKISHSGDVIVRYHADIRPGYEKLAEVLRCRVVLLTTGETLYDGLMRDMPQSLDHRVTADQSTESELYYEITAYLDTSVGNEYQNKDLIADFRWWVQEEEHLDPPKTGDASNIFLWAGLGAASLLILLFLVGKRRKEEWNNG